MKLFKPQDVNWSGMKSNHGIDNPIAFDLDKAIIHQMAAALEIGDHHVTRKHVNPAGIRMTVVLINISSMGAYMNAGSVTVGSKALENAIYAAFSSGWDDIFFDASVKTVTLSRTEGIAESDRKYIARVAVPDLNGVTGITLPTSEVVHRIMREKYSAKQEYAGDQEENSELLSLSKKMLGDEGDEIKAAIHRLGSPQGKIDKLDTGATSETNGAGLNPRYL